MKIVVLFVLVFILSACGKSSSDSSPENGDITVFLKNGDNLGLAGSEIVVSSKNSGFIDKTVCPQSTAHIVCGEKSFLLKETPEPLLIYIKKRNFHFAEKEISGKEKSVEIIVEPIDKALKTDDYATGFSSGEAGTSELLSLAYKADSELGVIYSVKFYIKDFDSNPKVYFQNTKKHPIHYQFARNVLGINQSSDEFYKKTYQGEDRTAAAGTILFYEKISVKRGDSDFINPFLLTFFPSDNITVEQVKKCYRLIEEELSFTGFIGELERFLYLPAGSTKEKEVSDGAFLLQQIDAPYITNSDLFNGLKIQILNNGTAYGTLKVMNALELASSIVSFTDILVLKELPNDLPIVGGTITEELQTPLAHVNVAAKTRKTPNISFLNASQDQRIKPFINKLVKFEVKNGDFSISETTIDEAKKFWEERKREKFTPQSDLSIKELLDFKDISFNDSNMFGVKTSNLAELSKLLPDNTPKGFGVPFYYYDYFMKNTFLTDELCSASFDNCQKEGRKEALCTKIKDFCSGAVKPVNINDYASLAVNDNNFIADAEFREALLNDIRYHINHSPVDSGFAGLLTSKIKELFGTESVRLRSSTNAEDLEDFSGAGLYSSYSASAEGDQKASERIRKVWASIWNFKAFEERTFWNIDHLAVKMGVLVHQSFPVEEANGVLITRNLSNPYVEGYYVNVQIGETSVTNPDDGSIPEIFTIVAGSESVVQRALIRYSSLSPEKSILTDDEVKALYIATAKAENKFLDLYEEYPGSMAFDIEFKFHGPERKLILKQIRPFSSPK